MTNVSKTTACRREAHPSGNYPSLPLPGNLMGMSSREFVHLHNHTEYSLLDGASKVSELAGITAEMGMPAIAMTDHGNLFGGVDFYQQVTERGGRPILGCEVYVAPGSRFDRKVTDQTEIAYHMVLLVQNDVGYRNLSRLVTAGFMEGFYYKPRIDWELLAQHHEGLIALSGCLQGEVAKAIMQNDPDEARRKARWFQELFGDRFYLEIQANGLPEQEQVNQAKIALAGELGIGLVATNDNHYLRKDDAFPHDCLLCIGTRRMVEDTDRMRFPNDQFYVKHPDEMWESFKHVPEAIENTVRIAERCDFGFDFGTFHLPRFVRDDRDLDQMLTEAAWTGLEDRYRELGLRGITIDDVQKHIYRERLEFELGVIRDMGFAGYFLIVSDFIRWAKERSIPVGPGRGSAAGSLVGYATRITDIDPIRSGLLFERFLNPGRKSMPDIDVDICMNRRSEVIEYVSERYGGEEHVAQIAAFGTAKGRAIFKDVGRVFGLSFAETDRITKLMPAPPKEFTLAEIYETDADLRKALAADKRLEEVFEIAKRLEGITRNSSVHAAGVVISNDPLVDHVPLFRGEHGETVTQFDMNGVESIGLVKFDFLGLKTLTAMQITVDLVREYEQVDINLDLIPEDDPKAFELLCEGRTAGVFQLESDGMRRLLKRLQPASLDEVIAVTALYRPGPMESGMLDEYVERKHGRREISYFLPQLEPILRETYGVIVYQEQVMEIAKVLGGFSLAEADNLRKAMGKKNAEVMAQQKQRFADGAADNGIDRRQAEDLFDLIEKFAGYGFNKSHSAAYGLIAYRTAWLKAHHPVAFMAALMQCDRDHSQKLIPLLREARLSGIEILPPDIHHSGLTFTPDGDRIRFGLAAIKGVGEKPVQEILRIREQYKDGFESLSDFVSALDPGIINRKLLEGFIRSGALDSLGTPRHLLWANVERIVDWAARRARDRAAGQESLFGGDGSEDYDDLVLADAHPWDPATLAEHERQSIGFYLSAHPLDPYLDTVERFATTTLADEELARFGDRSPVKIGGVITSAEIKNSPRGRRAFLQLEDKEGFINVGVFGDLYPQVADMLSEGRAVFIEGDLMVDDQQMRRVFAKSLVDIADLEARKGKAFHIRILREALNRNRTSRLADVVQDHPGRLEVFVHVQDPDRNEAVIRLDERIRVDGSPALRESLEQVFADSRIQTYVEA